MVGALWFDSRVDFGTLLAGTLTLVLVSSTGKAAYTKTIEQRGTLYSIM